MSALSEEVAGRRMWSMRKLWMLCLVALVLCAAPAAYARQERGADARTVRQLPSKEKRWALIIGVDDYGNGIQKLYGAVNDSKALKEALVKYANFPEEQIIVLTTGVDGEQPTRTNILTRLFRLMKKIPKDGLFLFAFSGHGVERDRKVFLLPSDALQTRDVEELGQIAIPADTITGQIERAEISQVLILLDACRNDPEAGKGDKDNVLTEAFTRGFNFDEQNKGIEAFATLYATSFRKRAYEFRDKETGLQRGFFTWALVKGLGGEAANANGEITLGSLVSYITEAVPKKLKAENVGGEQIPYTVIGGYNAGALVIALSSRRGGAPLSAQSYFDRGWALQGDEKFDDAIKEYEKAINLDPKYADAYINMGSSYDAKGDDELALKCFDKVIELEPREPLGYYGRGNAYFNKGFYEKAIADYNKVIELSPRDKLTFVNRGNAYNRKGDTTRALKDYDEAIRINSRDSRAYYNRAMTYDDAGRYDEALRDYTEVIALDPDNLEARYKRGKVYGAKVDFAKAITDLSLYLAFNSRNADAFIYRAALYTAKGNYKDALADLEKAISLEPGWGDAYASRGFIYSLTGEDAKALSDYNKALEINPKDSRALGRRGNLYVKGRQYEKALADYEQAVAVDPQDFLAYFNLGSFYVVQGDYARAGGYFKHMREVVKENTSDRDRKSANVLRTQPGESFGPDGERLFDHFVAGISFMSDKEYGKAAAEFSQAIKEGPQFTMLYLMRGAAYLLKGDNEAALSDVKLLTVMNPEDVTAHSLLGDIYAEKGDYRQAIDSYTEVIRLSPNNVQAYRDRADAYEKIGDRSKAKADRQRADALEGRQVNR